MASSRTVGRLIALALVFAGGALTVAAAHARLPASAAVAALAGLGAAGWILAQPQARSPAGEPAPSDARRLADERRRRTLETLIDQAPTPLLIVEPGAPPTAANRAARRLLRTDGVVPDVGGRLHAAIAAAAPESRRTVELELAGGRRTYALSAADLAGTERPLRLVALTDIQPEIQAAEAAALKQLLQVLGHEIMNSLTPVASLAQSAAELLDEGGPDAGRLARESVEVIARRTEGLHRFVEAYRRLARLPEPQPRTASLSRLLAEAAQLFETRWGAAGVQLVLEAPEPDVLIRIDPDLTAQALINLLANAAEAARAGAGAAAQVRLAARSDGEGAVIAVEDNGPGVDPAARAEIFRPFFTTKPQGSGVGLALARQAIVSQGGELTLAPDAPGRGARFLIQF